MSTYYSFKLKIARIIPLAILATVRRHKRHIMLSFGLFLRKKVVMFIDKRSLGGGSIHISTTLEGQLHDSHNVIVLDHCSGTSFNIVYKNAVIGHIDLASDAQLQALKKKYHVSLIFVNQLATLNFDEVHIIVRTIQHCSIPYDFIVHDYFCLCPSIQLFHEHGYKGIDCEHNPECRYSSLIRRWRNMFLEYLKSARAVYIYSRSTREIIGHAYPDLRTQLINVGSAVALKSIYSESPSGVRTLTIGAMGTITKEKGVDILYDLAKKIKHFDLPIKIKVFGTITSGISTELANTLEATGPYEYRELESLVRTGGISFFIFTSLWPETGSLICLEILQLGFPIATFDLGAQNERIRSGRYGWSVPLRDGAEGLFDVILDNYKDRRRITEKARTIATEYSEMDERQTQPLPLSMVLIQSLNTL